MNEQQLLGNAPTAVNGPNVAQNGTLAFAFPDGHLQHGQGPTTAKRCWL